MNIKAIEKKCTELFGECPLSLQDFMAAKGYNYSEKYVMYEAAKKFYLSEKNAFFNALCKWFEGEKMEITAKEAEERNKFFKNARNIVDDTNPTDTDSPVNWMAFPNDDPTIILYMGLPTSDDMCIWAQNYQK